MTLPSVMRARGKRSFRSEESGLTQRLQQPFWGRRDLRFQGNGAADAVKDAAKKKRKKNEKKKNLVSGVDNGGRIPQ